MKYITLLILLFSFCAKAQHLNKFVNKDSLFHALINETPKLQQSDLLRWYDTASDTEKEFLLIMLNMPESSKKALIKNIDTNYQNINYLKAEYLKLVPPRFSVYIEFKPADKLLNQPEAIDMTIHGKTANGELFKQDWNLQYHTAKLDSLLQIIDWNYQTLSNIKHMLDAANCISIENGDIITIGYARSGMGKYFYKLFDKPLTSSQIKKFNDGCTYIFYKGNIVLEYGGGAIGNQCFPD